MTGAPFRAGRPPIRWGWVAVLVLAGSILPARGSDLPTGVHLLAESDTGVLFEVVLPEPTLDSAWMGGGARLTLPGWGTDFPVGLPSLPQSRVRVALPPGVVPRLTIDLLESQVLHPGPPAIGFAVTPAPDPDDPGRTAGLVTGAARLREDVEWPYPSTVARLESEAMLRRVRLQPILLTPVRVLDADGRVEVARRFRIRLTWEASGLRPTRVDTDEGKEESFYRGVAINPAGVQRWRLADLRSAAQVPASSRDESARVLAVDAGEPTVNGVPVLRRALPLTPRPGSPVFRLGIREDGIVRLSASWLATNAPGLTAHPSNTLFIASMGQELPLRVVDGGDGTISGSDYLEFFGEMLDEDPLDPDDWQTGDFSDERPYLLGASNGPRLRVSTAVSGAPVAGHPVTGSFVATNHFEVNDTFVNIVPDDFADRWYNPNFLNAGNPFRDFSMSLPGIAAGTAAIRTRLLGYLTPGSNPAGYHRSRLSIGATVVDQDDWDGLAEHTHGADTPATFNANLLTPTTVVRVTLPFDRQVDSVTFTQDLMFLNWIEVDYPRLFTAVGNRLLFTVPNTAQRIIVSGLTGTGADASVWDVTPPVAGGLAIPRHLSGATASGGSPFSLTFEINPGEVAGPIRRLAVTAGAALSPAAVAVHVEAPDLATGGADWLLIGHGPLLDTSPGSALSDLVARRQADGLATRVVTARAAYDQFSWGIEDPQALRDLIGWSLTHWSPAPRYVLLVGDASYDYKNDYDHAATRNLLPTFMGSLAISPQLTYFAEDNRFAAVIGDDNLPDVMLGRLPAHSLAEAEAVFAKIDDYEALSSGPAWTRRAFFISDLESGSFESSMRSVISSYFDRPENPGVTDTVGPCFSDPAGTCHNNLSGPGPQFRTASFQALALRQPGVSFPTLAPTMHGWVQDGVNSGAALSYFIGHGFYTSWGREATFFQTRWTTPPDDVDSLLNSSTPTVLLNLNCITGAFQIDSPATTPATSDLVYSLAEDWVLTPGRGAVGAIAPSHLAFISVLGSTTAMLGGRLLGEERDRELGALNLSLRLHFDAIGSNTDLRSFSFIGDPATRLILPDPEPPGVPTIVAGNGQVALSWSAGPDAVSFRVERAQSPGGTYAIIAPAGLSATQFTDTAVSNGNVYYYRVVGRDSDGVDSVPSNLNMDCPGGPACAEARPLNPLPPATPAGFAITDPSTGSRLDFSWLANSETDLSAYRLRYGPAPNSLNTMLELPGWMTGTTLNELTPGETLYFVLEAMNTSGLISAPTPSLIATPLNVEGISPPATIDDLKVIRDGADTVLSWGIQNTDIYGRPLAVVSYRVYSSSASPLYPLDEGHRLATVAATPTPGWRHVGAATAPPGQFYLVVARDGLGFDSGSGTGLPDGIDGLLVQRLGGGMLRLTWPPVTTGGGGEPLAIDHYTLYASGAPFGRAAVTGMTPIRPVLNATTVDVQETEGVFFSVLAVDQRGSLSPF